MISYYGPLMGPGGPLNGAVRRIRLLVDYLVGSEWSCRILSFGVGEFAYSGPGYVERTVPYPFRWGLGRLQRAYADLRGKDLAGRDLLHVLGLGAPDRIRDAVDWTLEGARVVHHDFPWTFPDVLPRIRARGLPVALTDHNVEHTRLERIAWSGGPRAWVRDAVRRGFARRVREFELDQLRAADAVVCVTGEDRDQLRREGFDGEITVIPNPVREPPDIEHRPDRDAIFVGSRLRPNVEAARFIVKELAPRSPDLTYTLAGGCCAEIRRTPPNVRLVGEVDDAGLDALYASHRAALAPLFAGSGSSLKTIEALSHGLPVVSTATGIRGLPGVEPHVAVAADPDQFVSALRGIRWNGDAAAARRKFAETHYPRAVYPAYERLFLRLAS